MEEVEISIDELKCSEDKLNNVEVNYWKKIFGDRKPIPSLYINSNNEVVAFYNCFFALKDLGLSKTWRVLID